MSRIQGQNMDKYISQIITRQNHMYLRIKNFARNGRQDFVQNVILCLVTTSLQLTTNFKLRSEFVAKHIMLTSYKMVNRNN